MIKSYSKYESTSSGIFPNGYGKFSGTAKANGGGFSLISNIDVQRWGLPDDEEGKLQYKELITTENFRYEELFDLSKYDGLMINVAP